MTAEVSPAALVASDRDVTADLVLDLAVKEALQRLGDLRHTSREYRVARADWLLLPAARSAERILGRQSGASPTPTTWTGLADVHLNTKDDA